MRQRIPDSLEAPGPDRGAAGASLALAPLEPLTAQHAPTLPLPGHKRGAPTNPTKWGRLSFWG